MLDSFRRLSKSKAGAILFAIFIGAMALGFAAADIRGLGISGGIGRDTVAKVGREQIGYNELRDRVQRAFESARQENPTLTIQQFVRQGGVDQVMQQMADGLALEQFARAQGFGVSRKMEDAQIASMPIFRGLDGKFDQSAFEQFLLRQRLSEKAVRADLARNMLIQQFLLPASGGSIAPAQLALPYASMLQEQRQGLLLRVPAAALKGAPPTDAELNGFYQKNRARYTTPERRIIRYALIQRAAFEAAAQPSEKDIADAYNAAKADYAPRETRTISEVIIQSEADAKALAAKVSGGMDIAAAARSAGLEARTLNDQTKDAYAEASSAAVANAVFATAQGKVAAPARSGLGWHVARVDKVVSIPGKTIDQVRGDLVAKLKKTKADEAMADAVAKLEDSIADGATFDEVVASAKLRAEATPPLLADGRNPDAPAAPVTPEIAGIAKAGFGADPNDDPTVEQIVAGQTFALVKPDRVIAAAPKPLAQIRDQVAADFIAERSLAAAGTAAKTIAAKVNSGTPLAQAASAAGVALPAATSIGGRRGEMLRQAQQQARPELDTLFTLGRGKARAIAAPDKSGWYVVALQTVVPGDASTQLPLIQATQAQFSPVLGQEYGQQLAAAARQTVGVKISPAAVARLKSELIGNTPGQ